MEVGRRVDGKGSTVKGDGKCDQASRLLVLTNVPLQKAALHTAAPFDGLDRGIRTSLNKFEE
eukprot:365829-Hanusia_phi.AAC.1